MAVGVPQDVVPAKTLRSLLFDKLTKLDLVKLAQVSGILGLGGARLVCMRLMVPYLEFDISSDGL